MTNNQINFWRMRNDKAHNERLDAETKAHNERLDAETKRYNLVQEELRRIDQDLQRDLNAINAKYKAKELDLKEQDMHFQHSLGLKRASQADRQLEIDAARVQTAVTANYINQLSQKEQARANVVREDLQRQTIQLDRAKLPYQQQEITSRVQSNQAHTQLTRAQTQTEYKRPANVQSNTFGNYANPVINALTGVLRAALPMLSR